MARFACLLLVLLAMPGCSGGGVRQGAYDGLPWQHCLEKHGRPGCVSEPGPYDAYLHEHAHFLKLADRMGCVDE